MEIIKELDLTEPVAIAGDAQGVWIGEARTNRIKRYQPASGEAMDGSFLVPGQATALATLTGYVVVACDDGSLYWYNINLKQGSQQIITQPGALELQTNGSGVWVWDPGGERFLLVTPSGVINQILDVEVAAWTASNKGIYWIDQDGMVWFRDDSQMFSSTGRLASLWHVGGAIVSCSNVLWISILDGLGMISLKTLEPGRALPTPEGPVEHLVCDQDQRILGGSQSLFMLDPAVDANIQQIAVAFKSPLQELVCAGAYVWGLETDEPIVHILRIL